MTTKESIVIVLNQYYDRRQILREYRKNHRQDEKHTSDYSCNKQILKLKISADFSALIFNSIYSLVTKQIEQTFGNKIL